MASTRLAEHVGRLLGDRYRLIAPVGSGASGQVFLAEDTVLQRQVAVKLLHPALADDAVFLDRFAVEARMAARLNHPHVLAVHDSGDDRGPFLVTEFLAGGSLRSMLDSEGPLTLSQALVIGLETARALEYAHREGVIHRDIKPANLLFDRDGHVRVADFGLAKALAEASITEPSGAVLGTARYASPEQARGERLQPASDVYSLALVLIETVTGEVPFDGDTRIGALMARTQEAVTVPAEMGSLRAILARAGALDPADRPDAGELRLSLLGAAEKLPRPEPLPLAGPITGDSIDLAGDDPTLLAPSTAADKAERPRREPKPAVERAVSTPKRRRRRRWLSVLLALVLLGGAGVAAYLAWDQAQVEQRAVPELTGGSFDELTAIIGDFWLIETRNDRADGSMAGEVLSTDPGAGTQMDEGETLTVTVSLGEQLRTVPQGIVGRPLEEAALILEGERLVVGEVTTEFSETAPPETVLEILTLERELEPDSAVDLKVSAGPEPRTVPDGLVGRDYDDVETQLLALRLAVERVDAFDNGVAAGLVIATSPGPGEQLEVDAVVTVTVSQGPEPVTIPDVSGLDVLAASAQLKAAGLCIGETDGPADTPVLTTDPPAGDVVSFGFCVRIITSTFGSDSGG